MAESMQPLDFGGARLLLDGRRALLWPAERTVVVSDLHLGKGQDFLRHGHLLPPYDALATLAHLHAMLSTLKPARVIALGDSFHRSNSLQHFSSTERRALDDCLELVPEWLWVLGNHDPEPPKELAGSVVTRWERQGITFRHELEGSITTPHVIGHYHPKARIPAHRRKLSYPCFAWNDQLLIMPAFGSFTGGLKLDDPVLQKLLGDDVHYACTAEDGVLVAC